MMIRSISVRALAVAIAGMLTFGAAACDKTTSSTPTAPLQHIVDGRVVASHWWSFTAVRRPDDVMSLGLGPFYNVTSSPVRIPSVTAAEVDGALSSVGADVVGPERHAGVGGATYDSFPPVDPGLGTLSPVSGFVIPGNEPRSDLGYGFVIGVRIGTAKVSRVIGVDIKYQADGKTYTYHELANLIVCEAPTTPDECHANSSNSRPVRLSPMRPGVMAHVSRPRRRHR